MFEMYNYCPCCGGSWRVDYYCPHCGGADSLCLETPDGNVRWFWAKNNNFEDWLPFIVGY